MTTDAQGDGLRRSVRRIAFKIEVNSLNLRSLKDTTMTSFRLPTFALGAFAILAVVLGILPQRRQPDPAELLRWHPQQRGARGLRGPICQPCDPCENGVWDQVLGEQWVDCGGECAPCDVNFNGQLDPGETGIDCGGDTGIDCGELCGDGLLNGNEIDVDCGGPDCEPCPSCEDGLLNGEELGVDCGGPDCPACPTDGDCTNGLLDGDELYIDCGGTICPPCDGMMDWKANGTELDGGLRDHLQPGRHHLEPRGCPSPRTASA